MNQAFDLHPNAERMLRDDDPALIVRLGFSEQIAAAALTSMGVR